MSRELRVDVLPEGTLWLQGAKFPSQAESKWPADEAKEQVIFTAVVVLDEYVEKVIPYEKHWRRNCKNIRFIIVGEVLLAY